MTIVSNAMLWRGKPSHWTNFNFYLLVLVLFAASCYWRMEITLLLAKIPFLGPRAVWLHKAWLCLLFFGLGRAILTIEFHQYELTEQVLRERFGILNRYVEELELYRVLDTAIEAPLSLNAFGLATIRLVTNDASTPVTYIRAIRKAEPVRQKLRDQVEKMRRAKGILELSGN